MTKKSQLKISNLKVSVEKQQILKGIDLAIGPGEIHAVMGPNGSGKSTLAYTLAGHPAYGVTGKSKVTLNGSDVLDMSPDERSQAGLFLAFQYPVEIPGVNVQSFLRTAYESKFSDGRTVKDDFGSVLKFYNHLEKLAKEYAVNPALLKRGLNEGFSGGEKKRLEILQMAVLEPKYAILDETDSGLDIDAIKVVAKGVKKIVDDFNTGVIVITHYQRILDYLEPDKIHVVVGGKIVDSGGHKLLAKVENQGYQEYLGKGM